MPTLLAIFATVLAAVAIVQANDARTTAKAGPGQQTLPTPTGGHGEVTQPSAAREPSTAAPESTRPPSSPADAMPQTLDPQAVYEVKYEKQSLTLKPNPMYVDLDEPRANVGSSDYDLAYKSSSTPYFFMGDRVQAGEASLPAMTPQDCADRIRTAPTGDASVPAREGLVLCVMTSYDAAKKRGDVQRMVLLEVTGLAADKAVTIQLTAWNIPR